MVEIAVLIMGILIGLLIATIWYNREIKIIKKKYENDILQEREFLKRMNAIKSLKGMKEGTWNEN